MLCQSINQNTSVKFPKTVWVTVKYQRGNQSILVASLVFQYVLFLFLNDK